MARLSTFAFWALGAVVLASTHGADTVGLSLWDSLQPSHLPWAWNQTSRATITPSSRNATYRYEPNSTFIVNVGDRGELVFSPPSLNASVGSIIAFNFLASNHTLTQSNLSNPCLYNGGFDSGFKQSNPANISGKYVIEFEVQTQDPQWFFCAQRVKASHCNEGMVFSLNPGGEYSRFLQNARSTITADPQPTLTCPLPASDQYLPNSTVVAPSTGTISANIGPSSVISPPILNSGNEKPAIELGLLAGLYVLFL